MNRKLLIVLNVLFLAACVGPTPKDDAPASDLETLQRNVERQLAPRTLPNGKTYCLELAITENDQDECAGDLEDGFFLAERDKARALNLVNVAVERLKLARDPCGFFARTFRFDRCRVKNSATPD